MKPAKQLGRRYDGIITGKSTRLPGDYAKQPTPEPKRRKYLNVKVTLDGFTFDSKAEAKRYGELRLLEKAGKIHDLVVHPWWVILPAVQAPGHRKMPQRKFIADFAYREWTLSAGEPVQVVEDVKSGRTKRTAAYRLKRQMFLLQSPDVDFREIEAGSVSVRVIAM